MDHRKPKLHPQVRYTSVKDEGIVIAQEEGEVHIVNEVASFILPHLKGELTVTEIAEKVTEEFNVDLKTAEGDVRSFLDDLEAKKIILYEP